MTDEITKKDFVDAFTQRDSNIPMEIGELHHRLDIILTSLTERYKGAKEGGKLHQSLELKQSAANTLRGALIRSAQYINDDKFTQQVDALVSLTVEVI